MDIHCHSSQSHQPNLSFWGVVLQCWDVACSQRDVPSFDLLNNVFLRRMTIGGGSCLPLEVVKGEAFTERHGVARKPVTRTCQD